MNKIWPLDLSIQCSTISLHAQSDSKLAAVISVCARPLEHSYTQSLNEYVHTYNIYMQIDQNTQKISSM